MLFDTAASPVEAGTTVSSLDPSLVVASISLAGAAAALASKFEPAGRVMSASAGTASLTVVVVAVEVAGEGGILGEGETTVACFAAKASEDALGNKKDRSMKAAGVPRGRRRTTGRVGGRAERCVLLSVVLEG